MAKEIKKIVVKIGSSVIAPGGRLNSGLVSQLVKDILTAEKKGYKIVLVSSGAIACGLNRLGFKKRPQDMHTLMAISSFGQIILMDVFNEKFKKYKRKCAQLLLIWDDFDDRKRFMNVKKTIDNLLSMNIIPVINENDVVSHEEIGFGDNDRLSALVTDLIGAEKLIILSDIEGLLNQDKVVKKVERIDSCIVSLAKSEDKTHTKGGMITKLQAAQIATSSGATTVIACGSTKDVISSSVAGDEIGTLFIPSQKPGKARKRWIAFSKKAKGKIFIDKGAQDALLCRGKSLLAVGIINKEGLFKIGDKVSIVDQDGVLIGYGLTNYDSEQLQDAKQKRFAKEVIHRDNFVKISQDEWCDL